MGGKISALDVSDLLSALVDKSMVVWDSHVGRFHLSETVRAYVADQGGEDIEIGKARMFEYFAKEIQNEFKAFEEANLLTGNSVANTDVTNLRACLEWALSQDDRRLSALRMATHLGTLVGQMHLSELRSFISRAIERAADAPIDDLLRAHVHLAGLSLRSGQMGGVAERLAYCREQVKVSVVSPDIAAMILLLQGWWASYSGESGEAESEAALELARRASLPKIEGMALNALGEGARSRGDFASARDLYLQALDLRDEGFAGRIIVLNNLGMVALSQGDASGAWGFFVTALNESRRQGLQPLNPGALSGLAAVLASRNEIEPAGLLFGLAEKIRTKRGVVPDPMDLELMDQVQKGCRQTDREFDAAFERGKSGDQAEAENLLTDLGVLA